MGSKTDTLDTWPGAWRGYFDHLRAAGRSPNTIRLHRHYYSELRALAPRPSSVTTADLTSWLGSRTWAPETRKSARSVVSGFYRWAVRAGVVTSSPAVDLPTVHVPAGLPDPAPESTVSRALLSSNARTGLMVRLAAHCGLRAAEIAKVRGVDLTGDLLRVTGKGGKTREVPVYDVVLLDALTATDGPLFPNRVTGRPLTSGTVSRLLSRELGRWTGHKLRHRYGTAAYAGSGDLLAVMMLLGHSRPETTRRYVRVPDKAVRAAALAAQSVA